MWHRSASAKTLRGHFGCSVLQPCYKVVQQLATEIISLFSLSFQVQQGEFDWDKAYQSWITSAYFYGFVAFLVPGGWLVDR